jgi:hypothetical protein
MKLLTALLVTLLATPSLARADTATELTNIATGCPAMSADGKHIAIYSIVPGDQKGARTSLAVFDTTGKLEQRISIVPPAVDAARAKADVAKVVKLLDDGKYKPMSHMTTVGGLVDSQSYSTDLAIDVLGGTTKITLKIFERKITITGAREGRALAPMTIALPAKDGPCKTGNEFIVDSAQTGYDPKSHLFAFEVEVGSHNAACFAHDFVITLK